ncbi:MAG: alcohol dehydrogenase catalytic domain-containing protein [Kiritimatiellaeota bacterium]|nr:alcohol dehydrogenase catalytic domain-containing protein [Kiritimatiellota bacterium]
MYIPATQHAVQLVGPDELLLNTAKPVPQPGAHQVLCRVEVCGLCFSDLKLLKQFSAHVRKSSVLSGVDERVLEQLPAYVPGAAPTVPGHETVVQVLAVGPQVRRYKLGERYLVQTDWRWLRTANSNAAFGYNFEGALQEYVLLDERIVVSPQGESMLLPAARDKAASAIALCEPWACVEEAYAVRERQAFQPGGAVLVVVDAEVPAAVLQNLFSSFDLPGIVTWLAREPPPATWRLPVESIVELEAAPDAVFDDVIYFGANAGTVEALFAKLAAHGLLNLCLCGGHFGRLVVAALGRVHYGGLRLTGTPGNRPADGWSRIPATGEISKGDKVNVIGAGGPMGVMHVVRNLCHGLHGISVYAGDLSDERLAALTAIAEPLARRHGLGYHPYNAGTTPPAGVAFDYAAVMAPVPALVAAAVVQAAPYGIINIFAGIPAHVTGPVDLDAYVAKGCYFIGTSGSTLADMLVVKQKVEANRLDTNVSVAAVAGLDGAVEGIRAVEKQLIPGKILVYPACHGLGLTPLPLLEKTHPAVFQCLENGLWTKRAEAALLAAYSSPHRL